MIIVMMLVSLVVGILSFLGLLGWRGLEPAERRRLLGALLGSWVLLLAAWALDTRSTDSLVGLMVLTSVPTGIISFIGLFRPLPSFGLPTRQRAFGIWLASWVMLFIGASLPESTSPPAPQRVAAQQEEVLPYEIVVVYETGIHGIRRPDYRIQLSAEYSEAQARAIAASIVESRHMRSDLVNAAGFRFHFPGLDPEGGISNGWIYWAPDGDWGKAFDITAGDYDTFRFETYYYR